MQNALETDKKKIILWTQFGIKVLSYPTYVNPIDNAK